MKPLKNFLKIVTGWGRAFEVTMGWRRGGSTAGSASPQNLHPEEEDLPTPAREPLGKWGLGGIRHRPICFASGVRNRTQHPSIGRSEDLRTGLGRGNAVFPSAVLWPAREGCAEGGVSKEPEPR